MTELRTRPVAQLPLERSSSNREVKAALDEHFDLIGRARPAFRWVNDLAEGYQRTAEQRPDLKWLEALQQHGGNPYSGLKMTRLLSADQADYDARLISEKDAVKVFKKVWRMRKEDCVRARLLHHKKCAQYTSTLGALGEKGSGAPNWGVFVPFLWAQESGLFAFWVCESETVLVPRPEFRIDSGRRLHSSDGPALFWPRGKEFYCWHGVEVPRFVIDTPEEITVERIRSETNTEVRRAMIDRYGEQQYLLETEAQLVHTDDFGSLYLENEGGAVVQVTNSTPEPDGTLKHYILRVPPAMRTAREAVAWTFGFDEHEYEPLIET